MMGMTCNLENMLRNGNKADLEQLGRNLRELRDRYRAGDKKVVEEFFALYVLHDHEGIGDAAN